MNKNKKYFLIYVVNILLGLLYISPLIWMVVSAFKPENRIFADMSKGLAAFWPAGATLDNFKEVFVRSNMPRYILNSVTYVTILVFLSMAVNSAFGYALAKFELRGKNDPYSGIIFAGTTVGIFCHLCFRVNKLIGGFYLALIIPFIVKCFDVYLFRQFFLDVPDDLIQQQRLDGVDHLKPLQWSSYRYPSLFLLLSLFWIMWLTGPTLCGLSLLSLMQEKGRYSLVFRHFLQNLRFIMVLSHLLTIASVPMIIMFLFLQKYYVQGISTSGIKG